MICGSIFRSIPSGYVSEAGRARVNSVFRSNGQTQMDAIHVVVPQKDILQVENNLTSYIHI